MAEVTTDNPIAESSINIPAAQPVAAPTKKQTPDKGGFFWGTGRRKSSVARVRIKPGDGKMLINKKELKEYFCSRQDRNSVMAPLKIVDGEKSFDIFVNVKGGGTTGQAGAVLLGIARALKNYEPNHLQVLRDSGFLTRDGRMVERKKPGQKGARKKFQFSKR
ncbi:MAG: 30S ribosomal protein S9 [Planctomycetes bacterium]|nr:30S ribosomal protein S9 [Planctomycetota bacterium]MCK5472551.1 30S ribosomal protein S9 [Planctomycetota bacterium]